MDVPRTSGDTLPRAKQRLGSSLVLDSVTPSHRCSRCVGRLPGLTMAHLVNRSGARRPMTRRLSRLATPLKYASVGTRKPQSTVPGLELVKHRCGDQIAEFGLQYGEPGSLLSTPLRGLYTLNLVSLAPNAQTLLSGIVSYPSTTKLSGTIQRRLAWPLHKDDTHDQMGCTSVLNFFGIFSRCDSCPRFLCQRAVYPCRAKLAPRLCTAKAVTF